MRHLSIVAFAILMALPACAAVAPKPAEPSRDITLNTKIHTFALRNGMRVLVLEDRTTDLVYVGARYDVGAIEDPQGKHGLAHVAEHVAFLPHIGGKRLDTKLAADALGSNATTTWDYTHYYAVAEDVALPALLQVEAMRLQPGICQTVSDEDFQREREIVLNELRYRQGDDGGDMLRTLLAVPYPEGHPYRRIVGGDETQVSSITKADVCQFMDRYYVPAHVTLVISGNVGKQEVGAALDATLAKVPGRAPVKRAQPPAASLHPGTKTVRKPVDAPMLHVVWALPPMMTAERTAAEMAMEMIQDKLYGWNYDNQFARAISFTPSGGAHAPIAVLSIQLSSKGKLGEAKSWIGKAVKRFDEGSDDDSFVATKSYALGSMVRGLDSFGGRADRLADYVQFVDGQRGYFIQEVARIDKLSRNQVRTVGRDVFATGKSSMLMVVPDESQRQTYQAVGLTYAGSGHGDEARRVTVDPAEAHKPLDPPRAPSSLGQTRRFTLDNGLEVALLSGSAVPVVDMRLIFRGGTSVEPSSKAGLAQAAARMLSIDFESVTVREQLDTLIKFHKVGGSVSTVATDDYAQFRVVGMSGYFDILIAGLERTVKAGVYKGRAIEKYRGTMKALLSGKRRASHLAQARALYRAVYGAGHPYADRGFVTPESVGKINLDALQSYRSRYFRAANGTLVITGSFDVDLMEKHVRYRFGHWGSGSRSAAADKPAASAGSRLAVASEPRPTVAIDIAWPVPNADAQLPGWRVVQHLLSARVSDLREKMGATYGVHASLAVRRGPSMMRISGEVDRRRAGEALKALREAIESLRRGEGSFDADFVIARRKVAASYATSTNSAAETASLLSTALLRGKHVSYSSQQLSEAARLKPADVRGLLSKLTPRRQSIVLYGPRKDVSAAFAAAGLEPDWFQ